MKLVVKYILFVWVSLFMFSCGQPDIINRGDDNLSKKNDLFYYEKKLYSGKLITDITLDGEPMEIVTVDKGYISGEAVFYHQDGKTISGRYNYVEGEIDGEYLGYNESGELEFKCNYVNDRRDGKYEEYYLDGRIKYFHYYDSGKAIGPSKTYYSNGQLYQEADYLIKSLSPLGERVSKVGEFKEYDQNGNLHIKKNHLSKFSISDLTIYYPNGDKKYFYKKGAKKRISFKYHQNGSVKQKVIYKFNEGKNWQKDYTKPLDLVKFEGDILEYDQDGNLLNKFKYSFDKHKKQIKEALNYNDLGKLLAFTVLKDGKIQNRIEYYDNGNLKLYRENKVYSNTIKKDGLQVDCYESGKIKKIETYYRGDLSGFNLERYDNGNIKKQLYYNGGKVNENYLEYYDNGKIKKITKYYMGEYHGVHIEFDESGDVIKTINHAYGKKSNRQRTYTHDEILKYLKEIESQYNQVKKEIQGSLKVTTESLLMMNYILRKEADRK